MNHAGRKIAITVSNDVQTDQRMQRIAGTLAESGYAVTILGRLLPDSKPFDPKNYRVIRLKLPFLKGKAFYLAMQWYYYQWLRKESWDLLYAVDLDTVLMMKTLAAQRSIPWIYDAHEWFTEVPELMGRPWVRAVWSWIGSYCVPKASAALTVSQGIADVLNGMYGIPFEVVRNVPLFREIPPHPAPFARGYILYQGALNQGRGLEAMIDAMHAIDRPLWIAGEGDLSEALRARVANQGLQDRVRFLGRCDPEQLRTYTAEAWLGVNLIDENSKSYYHSLSNKFFDYIQYGVPIIQRPFPEYIRHQQQFQTSIFCDSLDPLTIMNAIQRLQSNPDDYLHLVMQCQAAAKYWHWDLEKIKLLSLIESLE